MFKSFFRSKEPTADEARQAAESAYTLRLRMDRIVALNARRNAGGEPRMAGVLGSGTVSRASLLAKAHILQSPRSTV